MYWWIRREGADNFVYFRSDYVRDSNHLGDVLETPRHLLFHFFTGAMIFFAVVSDDPTLGDGILDRLVHHAHRIEMKGDSMRKNRGKPNA